MINKDLYKQEVYKKYQSGNTNISIYEYEKNPINYFKLVAVIFLCIGILGGTGYAGMEIYKSFKSEEKVSDRMEEGIDLRDNYSYLDYYPLFIYYKLINNYDEYKKYKEMWPQLVEMDDSEFDEYVLLLTITSSDNLKGFYITNITADNYTMYIEYDVDENGDISKDFMSTKIDKDFQRDNIEFKQIYHISENNIFKKITNIPKDYSIQDAINDGCFVIENNEVISNNKSELEEFIINTQNGEKDFIRIYQCSEKGINRNEVLCTLKDIEFNGEKYIVNSRTLFDTSDNSNPELYYNMIYRAIDIKKSENQNRITVTLLEESGDTGISISYNME